MNLVLITHDRMYVDVRRRGDLTRVMTFAQYQGVRTTRFASKNPILPEVDTRVFLKLCVTLFLSFH